jgi:hypothetical protein
MRGGRQWEAGMREDGGRWRLVVGVAAEEVLRERIEWLWRWGCRRQRFIESWRWGFFAEQQIFLQGSALKLHTTHTKTM